MKKWLVLGTIITIMGVLIACSSTTSNNGANQTPIEVSEDEVAVGSLKMTAKNWDFDKEYYAIKAGEEIELTVESIDGVHGIEILGTEYNNIINDKATTITITEPGTYDIRCSIPCGQGHRTMTTKLVVV